MKGFAALLRLQLLSRLADLKPRNIRTQFREKRGKTVGMLIAYVFLFIYLGFFLVFLETTLLDQVLIPMGMPDMLLTMAVTLAMVSTLIMSFFFIMSSLYFGRDSAFIASLPVKPRTVLSAKLTQVWISETLIDAIFILPACIIYGLKIGVTDPLFYIRCLLVWPGLSVLPIAVVSFLSTLLIRLSALWKHREMVVTVAGITVLIAYMILCMNMGNLFGSDEAGDVLKSFFLSNQARIESLTRIFPPAGWAAKGLSGDWGQLILFLCVCAVAAAFTVWALGFVYRKLSLMQTETPAASRKGGTEKTSFAKGSAFRACVMREIRQVLRTPAYATNILPMALMPALMTGMMAFTFNRTDAAAEGASLSGLLSELSPAIVVAILTGVMAFMAGMNNFLSTAVTREGRGHAFLCALPVPARVSVMAKMAVGFGLTVIGCGLAAAVIVVMLPAFLPQAVMAYVLTLLYGYLTGALSLGSDVRNPKLDWLTETEAIKQQSGVLISMLLGWAVLGALGLVSYLLLSGGASQYVYFAALAAILAAGAYFAHRMLIKTADEKYCQNQ